MVNVYCFHKGTGNGFWIKCAVFHTRYGVARFFHEDGYFVCRGDLKPFRTLPEEDFNFNVRNA